MKLMLKLMLLLIVTAVARNKQRNQIAKEILSTEETYVNTLAEVVRVLLLFLNSTQSVLGVSKATARERNTQQAAARYHFPEH